MDLAENSVRQFRTFGDLPRMPALQSRPGFALERLVRYPRAAHRAEPSEPRCWDSWDAQDVTNCDLLVLIFPELPRAQNRCFPVLELALQLLVAGASCVFRRLHSINRQEITTRPGQRTDAAPAFGLELVRRNSSPFTSVYNLGFL